MISKNKFLEEEKAVESNDKIKEIKKKIFPVDDEEDDSWIIALRYMIIKFKLDF